MARVFLAEYSPIWDNANPNDEGVRPVLDGVEQTHDDKIKLCQDALSYLPSTPKERGRVRVLPLPFEPLSQCDLVSLRYHTNYLSMRPSFLYPHLPLRKKGDGRFRVLTFWPALSLGMWLLLTTQTRLFLRPERKNDQHYFPRFLYWIPLCQNSRFSQNWTRPLPLRYLGKKISGHACYVQCLVRIMFVDTLSREQRSTWKHSADFASLHSFA